MIDDRQLLQQYVREGLEAAFAEVLTRHVDLVYGTALRVTRGDVHLAQDVTQTVFIDFARKAPYLSRNILVAGWLYRHTWFTAAKAVRSERRRKIREQTAMEMKALEESGSVPPERTVAHLDDSLNELSASDRDAIVLRFLKGKGFCEVGAALGISEGAAQMRVSRALEKLRTILHRKGIVVTGTALASTLVAEAAVVAPTGLAAGVTAASLTAASGTGVTFALMKLMATAKLKLGLATACIVTCVVFPLWVQHTAAAKLARQADVVRQHDRERAELAAENQRLSNLIPRAARLRSDGDERELLRLRGEIGVLRRQAADLESELNSLKTKTIHGRFRLRSEWSDEGNADPFSAVETMLWASISDQDARFQDVTTGAITNNVGFVAAFEHPPVQSIGAINLIYSQATQDATRAVVVAFMREDFIAPPGGLPYSVNKLIGWQLVKLDDGWRVKKTLGFNIDD